MAQQLVAVSAQPLNVLKHRIPCLSRQLDRRAAQLRSRSTLRSEKVGDLGQEERIARGQVKDPVGQVNLNANICPALNQFP